MRYQVTIYLLFCVFATMQAKPTLREQLISVNSYWRQFKVADNALDEPCTITTDQEKIKTHLCFVEKTLRQIKHVISPKQLANRNKCLDILYDYALKGEFPKNTFHPNKRVPYFIDIYNTPCAVGHLIIQTGGVAIANKISKENNYGYIKELNTQYVEIGEWALANGFTIDELAWIQPTYGWFNTVNVVFGDSTIITADSSCGYITNWNTTGSGGFILDSTLYPNHVPPITGIFYSNGNALTSASGLKAGTYTVSISDACGMIGSFSITLPKKENQFEIKTSSSALCSGLGSITIDTIIGGTKPYKYNSNVFISSFPYTISNLYNPTLNITIYDSNNCSANLPYVNTHNTGVDSYSTTILQPAICTDDSALVQVKLYTSAGTLISNHLVAANNSQYYWEKNNMSVIEAIGPNCNYYVPIKIDALTKLRMHYQIIQQKACGVDTEIVMIWATGGLPPYTDTGLHYFTSAGMHQLNITDANGCLFYDYWITKPISGNYIQPSIIVPATACNDAVVKSTILSYGCNANSGNLFIYKYDTLPAGTHTVFYIDSLSGCYDTAFATISIPTVNFSVSESMQYNCNNAIVTIYPSGNCGPLVTPSIYTFTTNGYQQITSTDSVGNSVTNGFYINIPNLMTATSTITNPISCFGDSATVAISASGGSFGYYGVGSFTYSPGTYSATVTDGNGCTAVTNFSVTQPAQLNVSNIISPILCNGSLAAVTLLANGGTSPYSGAGSFSLPAGQSIMTITDANGCAITDTVNITQPSVLIINADSIVNPTCANSQGSVSISATGGTAPYVGVGINLNIAGSYTYTVIDANNCSASTVALLVAPPTLGIANFTIILDTLLNTYNISGSAFGGTGNVTAELFKDSLGILYSVGVNNNVGFINLTSGIYQITITDSIGCSYSYNFTLGIALNTSNFVRKEDLQIYPNPFKGSLLIQSDNEAEIEIYNVVGKLCIQKELFKGQNEINLHSFSNGVYFIKWNGGNYKVVKE